MPIFSKMGRNGYYGILPNRLLSPIVFTVDEVYALYFSMQTLSAYQSTPFHLSVEKLKQKFEACISEDRIKAMRKMERVFDLGNFQNKNECPHLKEILQMAIDENVCEICYLKDGAEKVYCVQFFDITSTYGQWYATAYNFQAQKPKVFRCDRIKAVELNNKYQAKSISDFLAMSSNIYKDEGTIEFAVYVSNKGADIFHKEHYPSMTIKPESDKHCITGFYNKGEENFIANYFLMYGDTICSIAPNNLKVLILQRLDEIKNHVALQSVSNAIL